MVPITRSARTWPYFIESPDTWLAENADRLRKPPSEAPSYSGNCPRGEPAHAARVPTTQGPHDQALRRSRVARV